MSWQEQLESILAEGVAQARQREGSAFDEFAGAFSRSIVLYGAGNLGRKILLGLRTHNIEPLAFADNNPVLAGKNVEGVPVLSPAEAARRFGKNSVFVVCVWHPDRQFGVQRIIDNLAAMGARRVAPFAWLFWKYPENFLPYYFWELPSKLLPQGAAIWEACTSLDEDASRAQFLTEVQLRIRGHFGVCQPPCDAEQYFPRELFRAQADECFVDCGAYDGDTIRALAQESGGRFGKVIAFEADAANFSKLQRCVQADPVIRDRAAIHELAVARTSGTLRFAATAGSDAAVSLTGDTIVNCVGLDNFLADETPTMIKMDIEGAELEALEGASRIISGLRPVLAICVYHCPDHLWRIPLWMKKAQPEAKMFLRSYAVDGWESVCYAVPIHRLTTTRS